MLLLLDLLQYGVSYARVLALRDSNNSFILNGNFVVSVHKKNIHVKGSMLEYSGSDNVIEVVNGTRMINEPLYLMVRL